MKRLASVVLAMFCCACLIVGTEQRAYAYVDPGSGLLIIQSAASVAAAVGYFFRRKLMALFGRAEASEADVAPVEAATPTEGTSRRLA